MNVIRKEEEQFEKTIDQGLVILNEMKEKMAEEGTKTLSGEDAFKLYDTYGFPIDLTKDHAPEIRHNILTVFPKYLYSAPHL